MATIAKVAVEPIIKGYQRFSLFIFDVSATNLAISALVLLSSRVISDSVIFVPFGKSELHCSVITSSPMALYCNDHSAPFLEVSSIAAITSSMLSLTINAEYDAPSRVL